MSQFLDNRAMAHVVGVPQHEITRQVAEALERIFAQEHLNAQLSLDRTMRRKLRDSYTVVAMLTHEVEQLRIQNESLEKRVKR